MYLLSLVFLFASVQSIPMNASLAVNLTKRANTMKAYDYLRGFLEFRMKAWGYQHDKFVASHVAGNIRDQPSENVQCILGIHEDGGTIINSRIGTMGELEEVHQFFQAGEEPSKKFTTNSFKDKWAEDKSGRKTTSADFKNIYEMKKLDGTRDPGRLLKDHCIKAALKSMRYISSQKKSTMGELYNFARFIGAFIPLPISSYDAIEAIRDNFGGEHVNDDHREHFKSTHRVRKVLCAGFKHGIHHNTDVRRPSYYNGDEPQTQKVIDFLEMKFTVNDEVTNKRWDAALYFGRGRHF